MIRLQWAGLMVSVLPFEVCGYKGPSEKMGAWVMDLETYNSHPEVVVMFFFIFDILSSLPGCRAWACEWTDSWLVIGQLSVSHSNRVRNSVSGLHTLPRRWEEVASNRCRRAALAMGLGPWEFPSTSQKGTKPICGMEGVAVDGQAHRDWLDKNHLTKGRAFLLSHSSFLFPPSHTSKQAPSSYSR